MNDHDAAVDDKKFRDLLLELGLNQPEEVDLLESDDRKRIEASLKKIKRKVFMEGTSERAWEILLEPFNAIDPPSLSAVLTELGLSRGPQLLNAEDEDIERLSMLLKKFPRKEFLKLFR